ncbi:MAG: tRNA pseudouridine(38-40) synthase TruA [Clostridia bacterium]|nr:tRNA pseudouridine(38-40) synthase TruA [Clostridia bacterium]
MNQNYKITLMYNGAKYGGWQVQKNAKTIQEETEKAFSTILRTDISLTGVSRTDAGVHALNYVANSFFDTDLEERRILAGVNAILPEDIRVKSIEKCDEDFHARYSAKSKTYVYMIDTSVYGDVFKKPYVWRFKYPLDFENMQKCTEFFVGKHDFSAFMSKGGQAKTFEREIYECSLTKEDEIIKLKIRGNGFLYNMVRIIAGTLVSVGRGFIQWDKIPEIILSKERKNAGITAPPEGLTLYDIEY